nr:lycopene cyclase domain-containing protein [Micromonospora sp. DSM 115978]
MRHLSYLAVLAGCLIGTAPLELFLRTRVYARWPRLLATLLPVVAVFVVWDLYAISNDHWDFDPASTTGVRLPGRIPLEELLFFLVVPVCAILTLEAVRAVKGWPVGDEPLPELTPPEVTPPEGATPKVGQSEVGPSEAGPSEVAPS